MKLLMTTILLFLSLGPLSILGWTAQANGPSLLVENRSWDFGSVPSDFRFIHVYKVKNVGTDVLHISRLDANCDCTTAISKDTLVGPGDSTQIRITFQTRDYYGTSIRKIAIESNDPQKPVYELEYSANIDYFHKLHTAEPKYLTFVPGQGSKTVRLLNNSDSNIEYDIDKEPDTIFDIDRTSGEIGPKGSALLTVSVNKNLRTGTFYSNFTVTYSTNPKLRLSIPIKVVKY